MTVDALWFWQANLGRGVPGDEFRLNFDRLYDRGDEFSFFCLQEVDEADKPNETDYILDRTKKTHRAYGMKTGVPILVPKGREVTHVDMPLACKGLAKYTPNRYVTEVEVVLKNGTVVGLFNTHVPILRPATLSRRKDVRQTLREETRQQRNGLWVADTNTRIGWPTIVEGEKRVINAGIDKSKAWAAGKGRVLISHRQTVNLTIDKHNGHGARLAWLNAA